MSARPCLGCGTTEGVASYNLCDGCADERLAAECTAQGVPFHVTDGPTLDRVITLAGLAPAVASPSSAGPPSAGGGNGAAGSTAAARGRAPRRTSDGTAAAPVPNRNTRRRAVAGTKNSPATGASDSDRRAAPDFAAS